MDQHAVNDDIILSEGEIVKLTGYKVAAKQLAELHRAGFVRARIGAAGRVVLEREHYRAVCSGKSAQPERPRLRPTSSLRTA